MAPFSWSVGGPAPASRAETRMIRAASPSHSARRTVISYPPRQSGFCSAFLDLAKDIFRQQLLQINGRLHFGQLDVAPDRQDHASLIVGQLDGADTPDLDSRDLDAGAVLEPARRGKVGRDRVILSSHEVDLAE